MSASLPLALVAITAAGFKPGKDVLLALDVASNELYSKGRYTLEGEKGQPVFDLCEPLRRCVNLLGIIAHRGAYVFNGNPGILQRGKRFLKFGVKALQFLQLFPGAGQMSLD